MNGSGGQAMVASFRAEISRLKIEVEEAYATVQHTMNRLQEESQKLKKANKALKEKAVLEKKLAATEAMAEEMKKELASLKQMSGNSNSSQKQSGPIIARKGRTVVMIQGAVAANKKALRDKYRRVLQRSLSELGQRERSGTLEELTNECYAFALRPREVVEMHTSSLETFMERCPQEKVEYAVRDSRLLLLSVIIRLAELYQDSPQVRRGS
jgi:myosin heavy subunit